MKQLETSGIGCGMLLITLGALGLLSTIIDLGSSNRAVWAIFEGLADLFGSITMFSVLTIGVGLLLILFIFLMKELSAGKARNTQDQHSSGRKRTW